jgi:hypothetical protein
METKRQVLFRKYTEHIEECEQCRLTPRSQETMCNLGLAILLSYREALNRDAASIIPVKNPRSELAKMSWDQLAQTLIVLENKPGKTSDDLALLIFIDSLIREKDEFIWAMSEVYWQEKNEKEGR